MIYRSILGIVSKDTFFFEKFSGGNLRNLHITKNRFCIKAVFCCDNVTCC